MSAADLLRPEEFVDALGIAARVLEDHSAAIDSLGGEQADQNPLTGSENLEEYAEAALVPGVGTELAAVLTAAVAAARGSTNFAALSSSLADGARKSATGPSGRLLAQVISGLCEVLANADVLDASRFSLALESAAERMSAGDDGKHTGGFRAVVAEAADDALSASDRGATLGETIVSAADGGLAELERGPESNDALAERGVVDASGAAFLLILDALAAVVTGVPIPEPPSDDDFQAFETGEIRVCCSLAVEDALALKDGTVRAELSKLCTLDRFRENETGLHLDMTTAQAGVLIEALVEFGNMSGLRITAVPTAPLVGAQGNGSGSSVRYVADQNGTNSNEDTEAADGELNDPADSGRFVAANI